MGLLCKAGKNSRTNRATRIWPIQLLALIWIVAHNPLTRNLSPGVSLRPFPRGLPSERLFGPYPPLGPRLNSAPNIMARLYDADVVRRRLVFGWQF
jgi:hypothetical protein